MVGNTGDEMHWYNNNSDGSRTVITWCCLSVHIWPVNLKVYAENVLNKWHHKKMRLWYSLRLGQFPVFITKILEKSTNQMTIIVTTLSHRTLCWGNHCVESFAWSGSTDHHYSPTTTMAVLWGHLKNPKMKNCPKTVIMELLPAYCNSWDSKTTIYVPLF